MAKKRNTNKSVNLTILQKQDLGRFGCAFKEKTGILCIDWRGRSAEQASKAQIFGGLGSVNTESGPLVVLALEISPVRPLPQYCYVPFDLKNTTHTEYLSRFTKTGEIKLCFYDENQNHMRAHQFSPDRLSRAAETFSEALEKFGQRGSGTYDFEAALQLLESWVRIPEFLEHYLSEEDLPKLQNRVKEAVKNVPNNRRELAHRTLKDAVQAFFCLALSFTPLSC